MIISVNKEKKDIKFFPKTITDGMNIGVMKEKFHDKGIPIEYSYKKLQIESISIQQEDLINFIISTM